MNGETIGTYRLGADNVSYQKFGILVWPNCSNFHETFFVKGVIAWILRIRAVASSAITKMLAPLLAKTVLLFVVFRRWGDELCQQQTSQRMDKDTCSL